MVSQRLVIEPAPVARTDATDELGNPVTTVNFDGSTSSLRVVSDFQLETFMPPELSPVQESLPLLRASAGELAPYLAGSCHPSVAAFAESLAGDVQGRPLEFLDHLTLTLHGRTDRHIRPSGNAREAHETLALGSGACRDLTVLFLEACRSQGLAARFVSGYQAQAQTPDGQRHLHAWPEVHLPGAGWRGWDPTHGVRVSDGHVALSVAPDQARTMPIEGGFFFRGAIVNSTLEHSVRISTS
jgi:transglutaminase-like putative cysteine protease